jgi:hypothetical protein
MMSGVTVFMRIRRGEKSLRIQPKSWLPLRYFNRSSLRIFFLHIGISFDYNYPGIKSIVLANSYYPEVDDVSCPESDT